MNFKKLAKKYSVKAEPKSYKEIIKSIDTSYDVEVLTESIEQNWENFIDTKMLQYLILIT